MKILLLQPPIQDFYETDIRLQPIGLCYLKAAVKKHLPEVQCVIKDYHQGWGRRTLALPKELRYLKEFYAEPDQSPFSTFHHYYHFGAPFETIADDVAREKPDFVGISSLFSPYYREVLQCAREIKKRLKVPIVAGGSHVSACPEEVLSDAHIDFIILGEGERPLVEFLKAWRDKTPFDHVPNLGFKRDGEWIMNPIKENYPIHELPHPDLTDLKQDQYLFEKRPMTFIITSRSCPHKCSFCSVHLTFGKQYRRRTPDDVLEEIKTRYLEGYRVFDFEDDNLTYYMDEMKTLLGMMIEKFPRKDIQCVAMNGISYLSLDKEILDLMKKAGFTHLNIALVSSDTTVRETTKRPHTVEKYLQVVQQAHELGFKIVSYQILGLPDESLDSMIQTLTFNARLPVLLGASLFYLSPRSPIAQNFKNLMPRDIFKSRLTAMAVETDRFKREDLYTLFITTRIINFLKGLEFETNKLSLSDSLESARHQDKRTALGAEIFERLLEEKNFYWATRTGLKLNPKFNTDLFFKVWQGLSTISTLQGNMIHLGKSIPSEMPA